LQPALRAYYIGHLGKYVPGKAWALFMRGTLIRDRNVNLGVAVLSAFCEVLTTMASGALLATAVFLTRLPATGLDWNPGAVGLALLALLAVPLFPRVFNAVVRGMATRFRRLEGLRELRLTASMLFQGLVITAGCWLVLGLSVWAMLQAVLPEPPDFTLSGYIYLTGTIALAYVAGFLAIVVPSGVGVREYVLLGLLAPEQSAALVALAVLLLRLVWTTAELLAAGILWVWVPRQSASAALSEVHCQASGIPYNGPRTTDDGLLK